MSVVENIIAMVVLMGLLLAAFVIITGLNVNFFSDVVDTSVKEYNTEKYQNDLDAVLNTTEPVSGSNYAGLLADAVYYRKSYFDYNAGPGLEINEEIGQYYNNLEPDSTRVLDHNILKVDKLVQLTFDKLYGEKNYYLEIAPLILKLRLYFVIDGSASLENETKKLKTAIPQLIADFNSQFDVAARVLVLAGSELETQNPCAELQTHAECRYLRQEEMYSNQVAKGWLMGRSDNNTSSLKDVLWDKLNIKEVPSFSATVWRLSTDEFLDDTNISKNKSNYFCSWIDLNADEQNKLQNFEIMPDFPQGTAGVRINKKWHDVRAGAAVSVLNDFNKEVDWQMVCFGYRPTIDDAFLNYRYVLTPKPEYGSAVSTYFKLSELFAFRAFPKEYFFSNDLMQLNLGYPGGKPYEDWATASVYATVAAEKENPSTMTVIIPISDELSLGSEALDCNKTNDDGEKLFCEKCNRFSPKYAGPKGPFNCPTGRSDAVVERAINIIKEYRYNVFPILANSCDVPNPYGNSDNGICRRYFGSACPAPNGYCGECFIAEDPPRCPGLTLETPGDMSGFGCDKKHCRDFIKEDMSSLAAETGGEMIELTQIELLYNKISEAIKNTIEKYKIKSGEKKQEEERFAFEKMVPLSNRLFANLKFWHYKHAAGEE